VGANEKPVTEIWNTQVAPVTAAPESRNGDGQPRPDRSHPDWIITGSDWKDRLVNTIADDPANLAQPGSLSIRPTRCL
jgi:hypothetical protein